MTYVYTDPFTGQTVSPTQVGYCRVLMVPFQSLEWPVNGNTGVNNIAANIVEASSYGVNYYLSMPPGAQVSAGQSILIKNVGAYQFNVVNFSYGAICTIAPGAAQYVFLTDNSTTEGTWSSVPFGAGTSTANAAVLEGSGLVAKGATLNQTYPAVAVNSSTPIQDSNRAQFLVWSGGVGTLTLPAASTVGSGWFVNIRNAGSGVLTIIRTGTDTIDSNISQQLQLTESLVVVSNGVNGFSTFAYGRSSVFQYTQLSKAVTGGTTTLSAVEYANVVQNYSGLLTSNQVIILPSTVQVYYLNNTTTGPYSLQFKTASGSAATVFLAQNTTLTVICDGTNVFNAGSAAASSLTSVTVNAGAAGAPTINFATNTTTGLYNPSTGVIGFASVGVDSMLLSSSYFYVAAGVKGGTF